jgi:hypothetical protein
MALVPLNKHELDLIIGSLKSYKLIAQKRQPLQKGLEDRHYQDTIQNMINKLEKYWIEESGEGKK